MVALVPEIAGSSVSTHYSLQGALCTEGMCCIRCCLQLQLCSCLFMWFCLENFRGI